MIKKHISDNGFTLIEALLTIITLVLIGFVGWYVYHSNHKTTQNNTSSTTATASETALSIPELGVSMLLPSSLKDVSYTNGTYTSAVNGTTQPEVYMISPSYKQLVEQDCSNSITNPAGYSFETIGKDTGTYPTNAGPSNSDGPLLKQFSNFYITISGPNQGSPCSGLTSTQQQQLFSADKSLANSFYNAAKNTTLIQ